MATSPTVLASTSSSAPPVAVPVANAGKLPVVPLLIAVVVSALVAILGGGGCVYYLARSGRLSGFGSVARKAEMIPPATTHMMALDPLLVNLADAGGSSYLRIALALRVMDATDKKSAAPKDEKGMNDAVASVRDTLLAVLGRQTSDDLLATDGKERLKTALKAALVQHNPNLKVTDVFFTDFLVQR